MAVINDYSPKPKNVSISGNATIASGYGKFGSASLYCPDLGSFLYIDDNKDFNLADNEYTIECWIKPSGDYSANRTIVAKRSEASGCAWGVYLNSSNGNLSFYNGVAYTGNTSPVSGVWNHIAAVYQTGNLKLYLNGTGVLSSNVTNTNIPAPIYIGNYPPLNEQYLGYIDDFRITKGVSGARYLNNFDPPKGPFPITGTPITGPTPPVDLNNEFGNTTLSLSWNTPLDDNGDDIIDYVVEYTENDQSPVSFLLGRTNQLLHVLSGLNNGSLYTIRIAAINSFATGNYSITSGIPATTPDTPTSLSAITGNSTIQLSWQAPFNGGRNILDYSIQYSSGNNESLLVNTNSATTDYTFTNLSNGTGYFFSVAAINILGTGSYSSVITGIPATVPDVPDSVFITELPARLILSWNEPYNGGSDIIDYIIQYSNDNGLSWTSYADIVSTGTNIKLTGLVPDNTYVARVAAVNIFGTGSYSLASNSGYLSQAPFCDLTSEILPDVIFSNYVYQIMNLVYIENAKNTIYELNYDINTGTS
jgi:predicted phage tail protein